MPRIWPSTRRSRLSRSSMVCSGRSMVSYNEGYGGGLFPWLSVGPAVRGILPFGMLVTLALYTGARALLAIY